MIEVDKALRHAETLTFDCYGTLIDWRAGLTRSLLELFGAGIRDRLDELFQAYMAIEAEVEAEIFRPYREVLCEVARRMADRLGLRFAGGRPEDLPDMLPDWPPFPDTVAALRALGSRYRLGVLSNVDRDLFAGTSKRLEVEFDFVVTAQDVGAYKPSHAHFTRMLEQHGDRGSTVHVAQSLFHDGRPANELDLAFVWINRYKDARAASVQPLAEFPDLRCLADAASEG